MNFRSAVPAGNLLSHFWRSLMCPKPVLFGAALLATASSLGSCSEQPESLAAYIAAICSNHFRSSSPDEAPFLAENASAMTKMMIDMGIQPSGDADIDFVALMTPHHQGAIEMAQAELRYGRNEQLKRMAQEIIVTQQQEIAVMRLALGKSVSPSNQISSMAPIDSRFNQVPTHLGEEP